MLIRTGTLLLSILLTVFGYVLGYCGVKVSCPLYEVFSPYSFSVLEPMFFFALCGIPAALVLLFVRDSAVRRWLSFARWYVPLSVVLIILVPTHDNSYLPLYSLTKDGAAFAAGIFFLGATLFIALHTPKSGG